MLSIGEFAQLGTVSVRTLRHYDEIDLLRPAQVDPQTGYRGYAAAQLGQLHRIVALKELGLSLTQVRQLTAGISIDELRGMLLLRRAQLEQQVQESHRKLAGVEARLRYIESEGTMPADDITAKDIPALKVVTITATAPTFDTSDVVTAVNKSRIQFDDLGIKKLVGAQGPFIIFFGSDWDDDEVIVHVALEVEQEPAELPPPATYQVLPAIEAAVAVRTGSAGGIFPDVVNDLLRWISEHGYQPVGTNRDIWVHEVDDVSQVSEQVFEIQMPFARTQ